MLTAPTLLVSLLLSCSRVASPDLGVTYAVALPAVEVSSALPVSRLQWARPDGAAGLAVVVIDMGAITVDGESVVALNGGRLPETDLKGALIWRLYQRLSEHVEATQNARAGEVYERELLIVADQAIDSELLWAVLHTSGQSGFVRFYLAVESPNPGGLPELPAPTARRVDVESLGESLTLNVAAQEPWIGAERDALGAVVAKALPEGVGCATYKPLKGEPWSEVASTLSVLSRAGASRVVMLSPAAGRPEVTAQVSKPSARTLDVTTTLSVLSLNAQILPAPRESDELLPSCAPGAYFEENPPQYRDPPKPAGFVTRTALSVDGPLDLMLVEAALERSHPRLAYCYQRALPKTPDLSGDVQFTVTVAGAKTVSAMVGQSTVGDAQVERCIADQLKMVRFPTAKGDDFVSLNGTFSLRPTEP